MIATSVLRNTLSYCGHNYFNFGFRSICNTNSLISRAMSSKVKSGDLLPSIDLLENTPSNPINIRELCSGKKVLIFAVPGAFTPGCSKTHLPGYVAKSQELKEKGVSEIVCVAVNDPFVMGAWGQAHDTKDKIRMLADTNAEFTKALGLEQDLPVLGGLRSKRYSMVVEDGVIKQLHVEPDGKGLSCSLAENMVSQI